MIIAVYNLECLRVPLNLNACSFAASRTCTLDARRVLAQSIPHVSCRFCRIEANIFQPYALDCSIRIRGKSSIDFYYSYYLFAKLLYRSPNMILLLSSRDLAVQRDSENG